MQCADIYAAVRSAYARRVASPTAH